MPSRVVGGAGYSDDRNAAIDREIACGRPPSSPTERPSLRIAQPNIFSPASMWMAEPVMVPARSEQRKATAKASSSGLDWRVEVLVDGHASPPAVCAAIPAS